MKSLYTSLLSLLLFFTFIAVQGQPLTYDKELLSERNAKDEEFRTDAASPLDSVSKLSFSGLNYYKPTSEWVVKAKIERYSTPDTIQMRTTTERLPLYIVYGKARFTVKNSEVALTVYRNVGLMNKPGYEDYFFIPFTDDSSGEETYGGGRYVDVRFDRGDYLIIDFNRAYNPYCVYNKKYSCPIPPAENYIPVTVEAGEKSFNLIQNTL